MAVEIITPGQAPADRKYRATCGTCGGVVEFLQGDAEYKPDQRDGDYLALPCPTPRCTRTLTVSAKNYIRDKARQPTGGNGYFDR